MGRVAANLFLLLFTTSAFAGVVFTDSKPNGLRDPGEVPREHHPASTHAASASKLRGSVSVVAGATDVDGPFEEVHLFLGDEPLVTTRWGDYFVHASFEAEALRKAPSYLELKATGRNGTLHQTRLDVSRATAKQGSHDRRARQRGD